MASNEVNSTLISNLLIALVLVVVFGFGYLALQHKWDEDAKVASTKTTQVSGGKYQAVFLSNGQVYFGKLADDGGNYLKLKDIYYLQQQDKNQVQPKSAEQADQSNLTLIKLGKELHSPADEMNISRQQVLFWENIKEDGKVYQAIQEYQKNNK